MTSKTAIIAHPIGQENVNRLQTTFPNIEFVVCLDEASFATAAPRAEIVFSKAVYADAVRKAQNLRWVQTGTAGVERWLDLDLGAQGVRLSNASGVHGIPMSENIVSMMLAFATRLHTLIYAQRTDGRTNQPALKRQVLGEKFELEGQTVCVIGLGDIGGTLAKKCKRLGMRVLGVRRTQTPADYVDQLFPVEARAEAMAQADHVALCLPLTPATHNIVDEAELRAMRANAYIYNVGRGASIAAAPLMRALREGWIAGAGLDVTDPEPLNADSPLWDMPNVILSLHTSGDSPQNSDRITQRFIDNLHRYCANQSCGDEPLICEIDFARGY
ncbi:MAG: D-2-hydroxyacid dehydrogenase [Litorilinea sp.]